MMSFIVICATTERNVLVPVSGRYTVICVKVVNVLFVNAARAGKAYFTVFSRVAIS